MKKLMMFIILLFSILSCDSDCKNQIELTECEKLENKVDSIQHLYTKGFPIQGYDNPQYNPMLKIQNEYKLKGCNKDNKFLW